MAAKQPTNPGKSFNSIAAVLILASFAGTYFFLLPKYKTTRVEEQTLQNNLQNANTQLSTLKTIQANLAGAETAMQNRGVVKDIVSQVAAANEDMPQLYIQMSNLKNQYPQLAPTFTLAAPASDPSSGARVPVTVNASGSYPDLKDYLKQHEISARPVIFTNLSFTYDTSKGVMNLVATGYIWSKGISEAYSTDTTQ